MAFSAPDSHRPSRVSITIPTVSGSQAWWLGMPHAFPTRRTLKSSFGIYPMHRKFNCRRTPVKPPKVSPESHRGAATSQDAETEAAGQRAMSREHRLSRTSTRSALYSPHGTRSGGPPSGSERSRAFPHGFSPRNLNQMIALNQVHPQRVGNPPNPNFSGVQTPLEELSGPPAAFRVNHRARPGVRELITAPNPEPHHIPHSATPNPAHSNRQHESPRFELDRGQRHWCIPARFEFRPKRDPN
jgi:hypothetical protein